MKRIFHIISHFDMGGAERVALNIALSENPDFEYHIVEVVTPAGDHQGRPYAVMYWGGSPAGCTPVDGG